MKEKTRIEQIESLVIAERGRVIMGAHKKVSRPKSPVTVRDPHYSEFDTQKERNIRKPISGQ